MSAKTVSPKAVWDTLVPHITDDPIIRGQVVSMALVEYLYYGVFTIPPQHTLTGFPETIWLKDVRES